MTPETGQRAAPGCLIAFDGHLDDPARAGEEQPFGARAPQETGEEGDVTSRIGRSDDRLRLDAEVLERSTARGRLSCRHHEPQSGRLGGDDPVSEQKTQRGGNAEAKQQGHCAGV